MRWTKPDVFAHRICSPHARNTQLILPEGRSPMLLIRWSNVLRPKPRPIWQTRYGIIQEAED
jgi:hypothetical protein